VPVLGVPVQSKALNGLDSLLSIVQMPAGVPGGPPSQIGAAGAANAGLFAAGILALDDSASPPALAAFRREQTDAVLESPDPRTAPVPVK
jgi:5-(carboxyamino)imidazole ribonucleotide mutase